MPSLSPTRIDPANQIRVDRAQLMRALRDGTLDPCRLVAAPPASVANMFIFDFLRRVPGMGSSRLRRLNQRAVLEHVNLAVALGDMHAAKRRWLAAQLAAPELARRPQG